MELFEGKAIPQNLVVLTRKDGTKRLARKGFKAYSPAEVKALAAKTIQDKLASVGYKPE